MSVAVEAGDKEGRGPPAAPGVLWGPEVQQGLGVAVGGLRIDAERRLPDGVGAVDGAAEGRRSSREGGGGAPGVP